MTTKNIQDVVVKLDIAHREYEETANYAKWQEDATKLLTQLVKEVEAREREVLAHFSYEDWEVGDDDKLRVGDYINLNHQRGYDGYEQNLQGKIVLHHVNKMPVILYNIEPETEDEEESGEYADIQSFFMDGWTFSRIKALDDTIKALQDNK